MDSQASDLHPDAASGNPQRAQQSIDTEASDATIDIPDSLYNQPPDFRGLSSDFLNENAEFLPIHVDDESQTTDYSYSSTCVPKRLQKLIRSIENDTVPEYLNLRDWQHVRFTVANLKAVFEAVLGNTSIRRVDLEVHKRVWPSPRCSNR